MPQPVWRERIPDIVQMLDAGMSDIQIAAHYGVRRSLIYSLRIKAFLSVKKDLEWWPRKAEIQSLIDNGATLASIARHCGVGVGAIKGIIRRIGCSHINQERAPSVWTHCRLDLLRSMWAVGAKTSDIMAAVNALTGRPVTSENQISAKASDLMLGSRMAIRARLKPKVVARPVPVCFTPATAPKTFIPEMPLRPLAAKSRDGFPSLAARWVHDDRRVPVTWAFLCEWARRNRVTTDEAASRDQDIAAVNAARSRMGLPGFRVVRLLNDSGREW